MTHSLINKCAKNCYNRTFIVPVIAKNVVTCFFLRHSVLYPSLVHIIRFNRSRCMFIVVTIYPAAGKVACELFIQSIENETDSTKLAR